MNLGQLIGELQLRADAALSSPLAPEKARENADFNRVTKYRSARVALNEAVQSAEEVHLSDAKRKILKVFLRRPGALRLRDIAASVRRPVTRVSGLLTQLTHAELLERDSDQSPYRYELTAKGRTAVQG